MIGNAGVDELYGEDGIDTASYEADIAGITVEYTAGTVIDGWSDTDTLTSIEKIVATNFADTFRIDDINLTGTVHFDARSQESGRRDVLDFSGVSGGVSLHGGKVTGTDICGAYGLDVEWG